MIVNTGNKQLLCNGQSYACVIGRKGAIPQSEGREGDFKTPLGRYRLRYGFYRADRLPAPSSPLTFHAIRSDDGWCDERGDAAYNQPVRLPYPASAERLMRDDCAYDVIIVLGHNDAPPIAGQGSAIFLHITRVDQRPTAGCIAVTPDAMATILPHLSLDSYIEII
ncbi:L,D-transpeptidase family protein [Robiginitomaculum antarcticum]|uniref:L,D-transpeptidase family protein n=1 Tax=Robiginitomaculum antarcticum TaxID=437507 RepID=UPI00039AB453|nr:L,D-transpeptidase family protein [Robiginitomaculum antarcticum]